jgi:amidase
MSRRTSPRSATPITRRTFLRYGGQTAAAAAAVGTLGNVAGATASAAAPTAAAPIPFDFDEATIAELQAAMEGGSLSARELTQAYLDRIAAIDHSGPQINSIIEVNPDALAIADALDAERAGGTVRGAMHGIPVLVKDNIATADAMETTAGSFALLGSVVPRDAFLVERLRAAGAIILGKTNLSEWANFRGFQSTSGWSGRAGVAVNPYAFNRTGCGSSTGSGTAIAANLAVTSIGTETDGSITCPAAMTSTVGLKPTVGLISRSGVIPIAHSQDTAGPMARTVEDAAITLGALVGVDPRDPATQRSERHSHTDYTQFLDPSALDGARIGIWRKGLFGFSPETDAVGEGAISALRDLGATVVDPANVRNVADMFEIEFPVLLYEFKRDLNAYLADLVDSPVRTLAEIIAFNEEHADLELQWFGQEIFEIAQSFPMSRQEYLGVLRQSKRLSRGEIRRVMAEHDLDAIATVTTETPWTIDLATGDHFVVPLASTTPAAVAGWPHITVPAGYAYEHLPIGFSFFAKAWQEPQLLAYAYAFEQGTHARKVPEFVEQVAAREFVERTDTIPAGTSAAPSAATLTERPVMTRRAL